MSTEELRKLIISGVVGVVVSGLIVLLSYAKIVPPVHDVFDLITTPLQKAGLSIDRNLTGFFESLGALPALKRENQLLKDEVLALREQTTELEALRAENDYLRGVSGVSVEPETTLLVAEVLSYERDVAGISGIKLSRGSSDEVYEGAIVYTEYGALIGRVISVSKYTCIIETIATPKTGIPVKVVNTSALGLLQGQFGDVLLVENVDRNAVTPVGSAVVTTGESSLYPPSLAVGTISSEIVDPANTFKQIELEPLFDPETLSFVLIVLK